MNPKIKHHNGKVRKVIPREISTPEKCDISWSKCYFPAYESTAIQLGFNTNFLLSENFLVLQIHSIKQYRINGDECDLLKMQKYGQWGLMNDSALKYFTF
jgi:hypothetical protein